MDEKEIRRKNLNAYIDSIGGQNAFIEKTGRNQGQVSGLQTGRLPFGERLARNIEKDAGLPRKWLDVERAPVPTDPLQELERAISAIDWIDKKAKDGILHMIESLRPQK